MTLSTRLVLSNYSVKLSTKIDLKMIHEMTNKCVFIGEVDVFARVRKH